MAKKMLIDATHLEETRVVVVDGNKVDDFDFESVAKRQLAGNIYLAKVTRVEPSLQAAFVEYGGNRHGFLAFAEIHPDYYQIPVADREALIAEEAAEQERSEAGEVRRDAEAEARKRRPRRKKGGKQAQGEQDRTGQEGAEQAQGEQAPSEPESAVSEPEAEAESAAEPAPAGPARKGRTPRRSRKAEKHKSSGLEVIDLDEGGSGNDGGADDGGAGDGGEVRGLEIAEVPENDGGNDNANGGGNDTPPKTMAEKTGLDEAETVSEDVEPEKAPGKKAFRKSSGGRGRSRRRSQGDGGEASTGESADETTAGTASDTPGETAIESIEPDEPQEEAARARAKLRRRYRIQDVVKVRQILLVQVVKEERGNKGAALTTYLSLPGRYCVLMPNTARGGGISRKITNAADRKRLRDVVDELDVPAGMGLIVRTAGAERTRAEIKRDFEFLLRQWEQIRELTLNSIAPTLIYEEGSLIKRSIRDLYSKDIEAILVEGEAGYREAKDYMKMLMPSHARHVQQYTDRIPLFIRYQVESYLSGMFNPVVQLRSGGYIVIGQTEALVAIDVNSGRSTRESSVEETATKTNLEAADEIARQLRLRDLAGLIVIDFIDMDDSRNNRAVEKRFKERLKVDRARLQVGRISPFGLLEMSRQRLRPGMVEISTQPCPHCHGQGVIRSNDSLSLSILREVEEEGVRGRAAEVAVAAPVSIANYIVNAKRRHLAQIEERYGLSVLVVADPELTSPEYRIEPSKTRTREPEAAAQVVTAESAVAPTSVEAPAAETAPPPEQRDKGEGEGEGEGEGRTRRRRGKRGGRRRRGQDGDASSDGRSEARSEPCSESHSGTAAETHAETLAEPEAGEAAPEAGPESGSEAEAKPDGERRPRKRRGGRSRGRRDGEAAEEAAPEHGREAEDAGPSAEAPPAAAAEPEPAKPGPVDAPSEQSAAEAPARPAEAAQARREDSEATISEAAPEPVPAPSRPDSKAEASGPRRRGWWQWR